MIRAALALYEATAERGYLDQALAWQGALDRHYANPDNGGYFLTADDAEGLVVRPGATSDDATPNPNGIAAQNLVRLAAFTGDHAWREKADRLIEGVLGAAGEHLIGHASVLNALDLRLRATEIVVTGSGERAGALTEAALRLPLSTRIVLRAPNADALPRLASRTRQDRGGAGGRGVRVRRRAMLPAGDGTAIASPNSRRRWAQLHSDSKLKMLCGLRAMANTRTMEETIMRIAYGALLAVATLTPALAEDVQVELNALENSREPLPHDLRDREQGQGCRR